MSVRPLSSVLKTLAAFDCIAAAPEPLRLVDIARQLGEARGAAHQRLVTLVEAGWIEQTPDGRYRLTLRIVGHAAMALEQSNLGVRFAGVLEEMVTESGETASLAVLDGKSAVIVRRVESRGVLRADLRIGTQLRLDRTAFGRVLVSFSRPEIVDRLRAQGVELPDDETITGCAWLRHFGGRGATDRIGGRRPDHRCAGRMHRRACAFRPVHRFRY